MEEFIANNASAIFGLAGASLGGILSFIASWMIRNREYSLRVWKILLDRQIKAHENMITVAIEMRVMVGLGGVESDGEIARSPHMLLSREAFEEWLSRFTRLTQDGTTWLSIKAKREVNFVQDYLLTLHMILANVPCSKFPAVGQVIRQDFIDLSSALEKVAYDYFENKIRKRRLGRLSDWHKYPVEYTKSRLAATVLLSNREAVEEAINGD